MSRGAVAFTRRARTARDEGAIIPIPICAVRPLVNDRYPHPPRPTARPRSDYAHLRWRGPTRYCIVRDRAAGFRMIGTFDNVGFKFGRWLDSVLMQRPLGPGATELPPTAPAVRAPR